MSKVFVSLGSNIEPMVHIPKALQVLSEQFQGIALSPIYESESVGFNGNNFINLVASFETELSIKELSEKLHALEDASGRDRSQARFSDRNLDIDILTYDEKIGLIDGVQLPRAEILTNAFVLLPLSDLVPTSRHPENGLTYARLWQQFDSEAQKLWRVDLKHEEPSS